jgi:hypothetical protein
MIAAMKSEMLDYFIEFRYDSGILGTEHEIVVFLVWS